MKNTPVFLQRFVQEEHKTTQEYAEVNRIGTLLYEYLCRPDVYKMVTEANRPGKSSSEVQNTFLSYARELGFSSEKKGLFENQPTTGLRPDYFCKMKNSGGILLEVERGKTIMNNMDLLDLWKCHICSSASYLFLMVPRQLKHNEKKKPYDAFSKVVDRMTPFFKKDGYTNVLALFIYGY